MKKQVLFLQGGGDDGYHTDKTCLKQHSEKLKLAVTSSTRRLPRLPGP